MPCISYIITHTTLAYYLQYVDVQIANALEISSVELLPIEISNVNDILALLMKIEENTPLNWSYKKDEEGNYIPETIHISFKDNRIEEALTYRNERNTKRTARRYF